MKQQDLSELILSLETKAEVERFLRGILSEVEIDQLHQRIKVVGMLKDGLPQHKIAEKLGVGVATVTRGSKQIQLGRFNQSWWDSQAWR